MTGEKCSRLCAWIKKSSGGLGRVDVTSEEKIRNYYCNADGRYQEVGSINVLWGGDGQPPETVNCLYPTKKELGEEVKTAFKNNSIMRKRMPKA